MNWSDVEKALPSGLQLLGAALTATGVGAPVGAAVAGIGTLVGHALGVDGSSPDAVLQAVQTDPAAAEKLAEVQENNKVQLQQLLSTQAVAQMQEETKRQAAAYADVASARDRDVSYVKVAGHNWRADILAYGALAAFIGVICALLFHTVADGPTRDTLLVLIGILGAIVKDVYGFEFGASQQDRSGDHRELLKQAAAKT